MAVSADFYSPEHAGMLFGEKYRVGNTVLTHRGHDIRGYDRGESIPSWAVGTVSNSGWNDNYGYFVSVRISPTRWAHWCHLDRKPTITGGVEVDTVIGRVGDTGSFAIGPHCHTMVTTGPSLTSTAVDPLPYITQSLQENSMALTEEDKAWMRLMVQQEVAGILAGNIKYPGQAYNAFQALSNQIAGISGGGYVDANFLDDTEAQSLLTSTANIINAHTDAAKEEILSALPSGSTAPTQFSIELTGTATA